ncbi:hypothetical protein MNBD_CHLOROFLEXI01-829, partial [hydrothermal vent metagenome]
NNRSTNEASLRNHHPNLAGCLILDTESAEDFEIIEKYEENLFNLRNL